MVTNYPQQLTATPDVTTDLTTGLFARVCRGLSQMFCGLGGHDAVRHYEGTRMMMRCTSCGHDTPGLDISGRGPRRRFEGDPLRHQIARSPVRLVLRKTA